MTFDPVNKPSHYAEGRQFETIEVIEDWKLSYRLGNCVKYISRAGRKGDRKQDLEKALWYLQREIEAIDKPSQYKPAEYEDVLEYYGQSIDLDEAWGSEKETAYLNSIPGMRESILGGMATPSEELLSEQDLDDAWGDFWEKTPDYISGWDDSLGPIEIEPEEIQERLAKKDLDQFEDDEIVSTIERRGMIIGFRKDGSSCLLKDGRCE